MSDLNAMIEQQAIELLAEFEHKKKQAFRTYRASEEDYVLDELRV